MKGLSSLELVIFLRLKGAGYKFEQEYRFCERRWRLDFAFPKERVGVEAEGGAWIIGRHQRPQGFINDMEKYNQATILGWRILRYTSQSVDQMLPNLKILLIKRKF